MSETTGTEIVDKSETILIETVAMSETTGT